MQSALRALNPLQSMKIIISAPAGTGNDGELCGRLAAIFEEQGIDADISLAHTGSEIQDLAQEAAHGPHEVIVAGGGDGTINAVASAIVDTGKAIGVLPLGTLNHFARDLRIPLDVEAAARTIAAGFTKQIDVAEVNGRIFVNNSSLGLYPIIVRERKKRQRLGFSKWHAFVWALIQALRRYPFLDVRLCADGEFVDRITPCVFIGNNEYAMDLFNIGLRNRLDGGVLSIYITDRKSRLGLITLALRAIFGRLRTDRDFLALSSNEVKIETRHKRLRVAFDGEITVIDTPLQYRLRQRALRVIVPKEAHTD